MITVVAMYAIFVGSNIRDCELIIIVEYVGIISVVIGICQAVCGHRIESWSDGVVPFPCDTMLGE